MGRHRQREGTASRNVKPDRGTGGLHRATGVAGASYPTYPVQRPPPHMQPQQQPAAGHRAEHSCSRDHAYSTPVPPSGGATIHRPPATAAAGSRTQSAAAAPPSGGQSYTGPRLDPQTLPGASNKGGRPGVASTTAADRTPPNKRSPAAPRPATSREGIHWHDGSSSSRPGANTSPSYHKHRPSPRNNYGEPQHPGGDPAANSHEKAPADPKPTGSHRQHAAEGPTSSGGTRPDVDQHLRRWGAGKPPRQPKPSPSRTRSHSSKSRQARQARKQTRQSQTLRDPPGHPAGGHMHHAGLPTRRRHRGSGRHTLQRGSTTGRIPRRPR